MKKYILIMIVVGFLLQINLLNAQEEEKSSYERLKEHVEYLAATEMKGRFPGDDGCKKAEKYILDKFKSYGLEAPSGGYLQEFQAATGLKPGEKCNTYFDVLIPRPGLPKDMWKSRKRSWKLGEDWYPSGFSAEGTVSGKMCFVGYGITAPELEYDDYKGINVEDKICIMLTNSPEGFEMDGDFADYTGYNYKVQNAKEHGAKGIIFIKINSDSANVFNPLAMYNVKKGTGIVAIQANRTSTAYFFPRDKKLFPIEQRLMENREPESFEIPDTKCHITVDLEDKMDPTNNVVGIVKGTAPQMSQQYIVVGAHYDHIGIQELKNRVLFSKAKIYNGADDNASGTAGLLELARNIAKQPLKRSVVFAAFSGGEMDRKGAKHYLTNPAVPLENTAAMINLDMIGRMNDDRIYIFGMKSSPQFVRVIDSLEIINKINTGLSQKSIGMSDHVPFFQNGIPVMLLTTGMHEDYHTPQDIPRKIHYRGLDKNAGIAESVVRALGNGYEKPQFVKVDDITANKEPVGETKEIRIGIVPGLDSEVEGCVVKELEAGSPASKAKIKKGDIITHYNGEKVENYYWLILQMRKLDADEAAKLSVKRGEEEMEVEITPAFK